MSVVTKEHQKVEPSESITGP
jgi:hypothetical protein